jgi:hypothetical protein
VNTTRIDETDTRLVVTHGPWRNVTMAVLLAGMVMLLWPAPSALGTERDDGAFSA